MHIFTALCFAVSSAVRVGKSVMICWQWAAAVSSSSCFVLSYKLVSSVLYHGAVYFRATSVFV
jgi:hypothetical protein